MSESARHKHPIVISITWYSGAYGKNTIKAGSTFSFVFQTCRKLKILHRQSSRAPHLVNVPYLSLKFDGIFEFIPTPSIVFRSVLVYVYDYRCPGLALLHMLSVRVMYGAGVFYGFKNEPRPGQDSTSLLSLLSLKSIIARSTSAQPYKGLVPPV